MGQQGYDQQYNGPQYNYGMQQQYPPPQGAPGYMPGQMAPGQMPPGAMQQGYAMGYGYGQPQPGGYPQPQMQYPPPIVNQPMAENGGWMNMPQGQLNCPPGLEYLSTIDQLLVHQKVELLEAFTSFETKNKYSVKNNLGQKVYFAVEESDCCTRNCCGPLRSFDMKILDNYQNEVIHLHRPLACQSCCFPCCLQSMEVYAPLGSLVGSIQQEWSLCKPSFTIKNPLGETMLRIKGPLCQFSLCGDVEFKIKSADGEHDVGRISKQWSGLVREAFTDADNFGITFPMDLDVKMKAVMLGACFLIDFMYFEQTGNRHN